MDYIPCAPIASHDKLFSKDDSVTKMNKFALNCTLLCGMASHFVMEIAQSARHLFFFFLGGGRGEDT